MRYNNKMFVYVIVFIVGLVIGYLFHQVNRNEQFNILRDIGNAMGMAGGVYGRPAPRNITRAPGIIHGRPVGTHGVTNCLAELP